MIHRCRSADFYMALQQDIASVESFVHIHRCDARLTIARRDCGLDRRCSSPARKKRRMQVQTSQAGNFEHITRQNLAVGNDDNYIGLERTELFDGLWISNFRWLQNLKGRRLPRGRTSHGGLETAAPCDLLFNWRRFNALLAPDSLIRLSDDRNDFVLGVQQCL